MAHALLKLGLQRTVLGVAAGIAMDDDPVAASVATVSELRELLQRHPQRHSGGTIVGVCRGLYRRPLIGHRSVEQRCLVLPDGAEIELVQIFSRERKEESPAAHV